MQSNPKLFSIAYSIGYYAAQCEEERKKQSSGDSAKSPEGNLCDVINLTDSLVEIGSGEITLEELCSSKLLESTNGTKPTSKFQASTLKLTIISEENGAPAETPVLTLKFPADLDFTDKVLGKLVSKINSGTSIERYLCEKEEKVNETEAQDDITNEWENESRDKNDRQSALDVALDSKCEQEQLTSETVGKALTSESDVLKTLLGGTEGGVTVLLSTISAKTSKTTTGTSATVVKPITEGMKPKPEMRVHGSITGSLAGKLLKNDLKSPGQLAKNEFESLGLLPKKEFKSFPDQYEKNQNDTSAGNAVSTAPEFSVSSVPLPKNEPESSTTISERTANDNKNENTPNGVSEGSAANSAQKCSVSTGLPSKIEPKSLTKAPERNENNLDVTLLQKPESRDNEFHRSPHPKNEHESSATTRNGKSPNDLSEGRHPGFLTTKNDLNESSLQKPENHDNEYHMCTAKRLREGWLIFGKLECLICGCPLMVAPDQGTQKGVCVNESCKLGEKSGRASPTPTCGTEVETWNGTEVVQIAETFSTSDNEFGMQHGDPKIVLDEIEQGSGLLSKPPKPDGRHLKDNSNNFRNSCPKENHDNSIVPDNAESHKDKCGAKEKVNPVIAPRPPRPTPPAPDQRTGPKRTFNEQAENVQIVPAKSKQPPKPGDFASELCPDSRSVYSRTSKKQQRPSPDCNTIYSHAPKEVSQPILDSKSVYSRSSRRHKQPRPEDCKSVCTRKTNKGVKSSSDGGNNDKHLHSRQDDVDCKFFEKSKTENRQPDACKSACSRRPSPDCCLTACSGRRSRYGPPSVVVRMPNSRMDDDEDSASELSDHAETVVADTLSAVVKRMNAVITNFKDIDGLATESETKRNELTELIKTLSSAAEAVRKLEQLQLQD